MRKIGLLLVGAASVIVGIAACGGHHKGGSPSPSPTQTPNPNLAHVTTRLERIGAAFTGAQNSIVGWNSSVTFHSLEVPIKSIALEVGTNGGGGGLIYACPAEPCLVDLASGGPLQNLLSGAANGVAAGTYDTVAVSTCSTASSYTAHVSADVMIGGTVYYTSTSALSGLSSTGPAQSIPLTYFGCARAYPLEAPLTLSTADSVTLSLFFEDRDLAWGAQGDALSKLTWVASGCSSPDANTAPFLCVTYPDVAATVGATAPTIEHYLLNDQGDFALFFQDSAFIGGTTRSHFVDEIAPGGDKIPAGVPIAIFTSNGGGTFRLAEPGTFFTSLDFRRLAVAATAHGTFTDYMGTGRTYVEKRTD